ncbi:ABC-type multidrug transport system fused ATPase/permease subunit [Arthrobacter sp. B2I5]|uniref:hypothetical protein n=1 Tax=Arthrobacter sp. B2I5 TaxID=3042266 RepID=UPI002780A108|nr:hypothetical protein [Arthrobacter sp. B2I5]MDQ0825419.1 ABC-type multidrug transport system fused ATPase/permease subunit [Arthrobacter sp. B2I5]
MSAAPDNSPAKEDAETTGEGGMETPPTQSGTSALTWRGSDEFATFKRSAIIMGAIAVLLLAAITAYLSFFKKPLIDQYGTDYVLNSGGGYYKSNGLELILDMVTFSVAMVVVMLLVAIYYQYGEQQRRFQNSVIISRIADDDAIDAATDFKTIWKGNRKHLKSYHQIVMNYAESTKKSTGLYIMIGFIFILVTAAFALSAQSTSAAISSAVVATAASVLTGFIAKAVLTNSATSSKELQNFFNHPIEVERALAAERLIGTFESPARRDEARLLIIQSLTRQESGTKATSLDAPASDSEPNT